MLAAEMTAWKNVAGSWQLNLPAVESNLWITLALKAERSTA